MPPPALTWGHDQVTGLKGRDSTRAELWLVTKKLRTGLKIFFINKGKS